MVITQVTFALANFLIAAESKAIPDAGLVPNMGGNATQEQVISNNDLTMALTKNGIDMTDTDLFRIHLQAQETAACFYEELYPFV